MAENQEKPEEVKAKSLKEKIAEFEKKGDTKVKVKLKCTYPKADKDGKRTGRHKPDETIEVKGKVAANLLRKAMAVLP